MCRTPEFKCLKSLFLVCDQLALYRARDFTYLRTFGPSPSPLPILPNFSSTWIARIPQHVGISLHIHPVSSPYMVSIQALWEGSSLLAQDPRQPTRDSLQMEGTGPCPHGQPSEDMDARKAKEGSLKVVRYWCINTHVGNAPSALPPPKPWGWVPGVGTSTVWCFSCLFWFLSFLVLNLFFKLFL